MFFTQIMSVSMCGLLFAYITFAVTKKLFHKRIISYLLSGLATIIMYIVMLFKDDFSKISVIAFMIITLIITLALVIGEKRALSSGRHSGIFEEDRGARKYALFTIKQAFKKFRYPFLKDKGILNNLEFQPANDLINENDPDYVEEVIGKKMTGHFLHWICIYIWYAFVFGIWFWYFIGYSFYWMFVALIDTFKELYTKESIKFRFNSVASDIINSEEVSEIKNQTISVISPVDEQTNQKNPDQNSIREDNPINQPEMPENIDNQKADFNNKQPVTENSQYISNVDNNAPSKTNPFLIGIIILLVIIMGLLTFIIFSQNKNHKEQNNNIVFFTSESSEEITEFFSEAEIITTQEEKNNETLNVDYEKLCNDKLKEFIYSDNFNEDFLNRAKYIITDINGDNIPELFIQYPDISSDILKIYAYQNFKYEEIFSKYGEWFISSQEHLILIKGYEGGNSNTLYQAKENNNIEMMDSLLNNPEGSFYNNNAIPEKEYDKLLSQIEEHNWTEPCTSSFSDFVKNNTDIKINYQPVVTTMVKTEPVTETPTTTEKPKVIITPTPVSNMQGQLNCNGGIVSGYSTSYVCESEDISTVRKSLGDKWHVTAKNKCFSYGIEWYELWDTDDGDYYGWVDASYIDFYQQPQGDIYKNNASNDMYFGIDYYATVATESTGLRLRNAPNTESDVILEMPKGSAVEVLGENSSWCYLRYTENGIIYYGYASRQYIK